jgi:hypothetical protein
MAQPRWESISMIFSMLEDSRSEDWTRFSTPRMTPSDVCTPTVVDPSFVVETRWPRQCCEGYERRDRGTDLDGFDRILDCTSRSEIFGSTGTGKEEGESPWNSRPSGLKVLTPRSYSERAMMSWTAATGMHRQRACSLEEHCPFLLCRALSRTSVDKRVSDSRTSSSCLHLGSFISHHLGLAFISILHGWLPRFVSALPVTPLILTQLQKNGYAGPEQLEYAPEHVAANTKSLYYVRSSPSQIISHAFYTHVNLSLYSCRITVRRYCRSPRLDKPLRIRLLRRNLFGNRASHRCFQLSLQSAVLFQEWAVGTAHIGIR